MISPFGVFCDTFGSDPNASIVLGNHVQLKFPEDLYSTLHALFHPKYPCNSWWNGTAPCVEQWTFIGRQQYRSPWVLLRLDLLSIQRIFFGLGWKGLNNPWTELEKQSCARIQQSKKKTGTDQCVTNRILRTLLALLWNQSYSLRDDNISFVLHFVFKEFFNLHISTLVVRKGVALTSPFHQQMILNQWRSVSWNGEGSPIRKFNVLGATFYRTEK